MIYSMTSKMILIKAAVESYPNSTPAAQRELGEALFWLCEVIEQELAANPKKISEYCMSHVLLIKASANDMVKRTLAAFEISQMEKELGALVSCTATELRS
jgi:hypothetical protein